MTGGILVLRCSGAEHAMQLSTRDVRLLDADYLFPEGWSYRHLLAVDFIQGLGTPPPLGVVLRQHKRTVVLAQLEMLLAHFEDFKDVISHSYQYSFSGGPEAGRKGGGSISGFRVDGLFGSISVRPGGYCFVTLSELAPTGRGRVVQVIDMRNRGPLETDDWGCLRVSRAKSHEVRWFVELPAAITWLQSVEGPVVEVLHG